MSEIDIKNMNVAQVRKALSTLRSSWENHSPLTPFCLSEKIEGEITSSHYFLFFMVLILSKRLLLETTVNQNQMETEMVSLQDSCPTSISFGAVEKQLI